MSVDKWQERIGYTQAENVPLITNCVLAVQILASIRDYIIIDYVPTALLIINGVVIILLAFMAYWSRRYGVKAARSNQFVMLAIVAFSIKSIAIVMVEQAPYPLIMAVLMFALSLCFLSQFYLLLTAALIAITWTAVALVSLTTLQVVSTLLIMVVASLLGLFVLERRIQGLIRIYELEKRAANLERILPMCASCKKTRDASGNWMSIEEYIEDQEGLQVSHGVCPACEQKLYPGIGQKKQSD